MQIYEINQVPLNEANPIAAVTGAVGKGVGAIKKAGTSVASPFRDAGAAYKSSQIAAKTNSLADKALRAWTQYVNQRISSMDDAEKQAYLSGSDKKMNQDLMSFVQKNMLGNQPFTNVNVGNDMLKVIGQIAPAQQATPAAATSPAPQQQIAQKRQQKLAAATKAVDQQAAPFSKVTTAPAVWSHDRIPTASPRSPIAKSTPATQPTAPVVGGVPQTKATTMMPTNMGQGATVVPGAKSKPTAIKAAPPAGAPTAAEYSKLDDKIKAALAKQEPQANLSEATVAYQPTQAHKDAFVKLAQLAATAQRPADTQSMKKTLPGTQPSAGTTPIANALGKAGVNTKQLAALGTAIAPNATLKSTGNASVDALLKNMGFQIS